MRCCRCTRREAAAPDIDLARVKQALAGAGSTDAQVLDLKSESDALYASYLHEAIRLSLAGLAAIVALLWLTLRSPVRAARVLAPLVLAVLCVAAALSACGRQLTILHLVGMLLIVAVGSNYALFFDAPRRADGNGALTLASLSIANLSTVIGFGLLSFSGVPVLEDLGMTVAPGALLALLFAAVLTPSRRPDPSGRAQGRCLHVTMSDTYGLAHWKVLADDQKVRVLKYTLPQRDGTGRPSLAARRSWCMCAGMGRCGTRGPTAT